LRYLCDETSHVPWYHGKFSTAMSSFSFLIQLSRLPC